MSLPAGLIAPMDRIAELCRQYRVHELSVFGSASRGEMGPHSDIDLVVEFEPDAEIGLLEFARLEMELADLFGHTVDPVSKRGLKPRIRPHVLSDAKLLYAA